MATRNIDNADATLEREAAQHVNDLAKAYNAAAAAAGGLTTEEKELLGLSKQLELSLQNIVASKVLRNNESRTTKQITQELKNLEASRLKSLNNQASLNNKLNDQLIEQRRIASAANNEVNFQNNLHQQHQQLLETSQRKIYQLAQDINLATKDKLIAEANGDKALVKRLNTQIKINNNALNAERIKEGEYRRDTKHAADELKAQQKILNLSETKIEDLKNTQIQNNSIITQLDTEIRLLEKAKRIEIGNEINKFLTNKVAILAGILGIKNLIDLLFAADKQVVNLAESLGIARESAQDIRFQYVEFVKTIKDGSISVTDMFEAQANLSKELGIAVRFADAELKTFNDLTKLMGVSNKAAATLNKLAKSTTDNTTKLKFEYEKYVTSALEGAFLAEEQLHLQVSSKDILEDIGNLSAGILVKFQGNPKALGEAVIQAKKLGLSLEQVDKIGESLLNWESSIENELKAELLTGRELNLERARSAALFGDQASLMAEISAQVGTQADFTKLNVLAQKSLAESFGLSRDEMADMLLQQELINSNVAGAKELTAQQRAEFAKQGGDLGEFVKKQGMQVSLQEKFTNSMDKLKQTLIVIVDGPFGKLLNGVIKLLNHTWVLNGLFIGISGLMGGAMLKNVFALGAGLARMLALESARSVFATISTSMWTLGVGAAVAMSAAIIAINSANNEAAAAAAKAKQGVKDGIAPSSRGPFTITDNYGATAITANGDGLAVSPNINRGSNNQSQYDWKKLEDKLEKLIAINQQQYEIAKGGNVIQINEFALGKAAPLASFKENSRTFY